MCFGKYDDTELRAAILSLATRLDEAAQDLQIQIAELAKVVEDLKPEPTPPVDPPELALPTFIDFMRREHPDYTDWQLSDVVELTALEDTDFYIPSGKLNDLGWMILVKAPNQEIKAGQSVKVYRWAFPANAGTVRETLYHPDGKQKMLIDIKKFSRPV